MEFTPRRTLFLTLLVAASLQGQGFRERVDVTLVRVDLLATDEKGKPVRGLTSGDFRVLVDGRPVPVESLEPPQPVLPDVPRALPDLPRGKPLSPASAIPAAAAATPRYYMAILADETSSEQSNRHAVFREFFGFLQKGLPADVRVQLMRFDGKLRVVCPWTADPERLERGLAVLVRRKAAARLGAPGNIANAPEHGPQRPDLDAREATLHRQASLMAVFEALREFPETPIRKALFFITDGSPFLSPVDISRDLVQTSSSEASGPDGERLARMETERDSGLLLDSLSWDRTLSAPLLTEITRLAVLRGVEIHPVRSAAHDLGALVRADRSFSSRVSAGGGRSLDPRSTRSALTPPTTDIAAGQGMENLAEASGGEAILSRRFFDDGLRRETDYRDAAYVLAFRDPYAGDHRFHSIAVTSSRPGVKLRYRRGYRVLDVKESLLQASINRMHVPADENPLGVRLELDSLGEQDGQVVAQVRVAYPAPPEAGGGVSARTGSVQVLGICGVRDLPLSSPIDFTGPAEPVAFGGTSWLVRSGQIRIRPGAYRWSFAIRDEQTGITSYLTFDRRLP